MPPAGEAPERIPRGMIVAFVFLFLLIVLAGTQYYQSQEQQMTTQVSGDLTSIALLKADQISLWRAERLGDAKELSGNPILMEGVREYINSRDPVRRQEILTLFDQLNTSHQYRNVRLFDRDGRLILSLTPNVTTTNPRLLNQLASADASGDPVLTDLIAASDGTTPRIYLISPIPASDTAGSGTVGSIVATIDPGDFLYPLIDSWPVPRTSAETLLVEREGDHVLFLNNLRYRNNTALNLTIPLSQTDVPAVKAALGTTGIFQGKDYRGVDVISELEPVPGSPWYIVAKQDTDEAYATWRTRALFIIMIVGGAIISIFILFALVWQRRQKYYFRSLLSAEANIAKAQQQYREIFENVNIGILRATPGPQGSLIDANPAAIRIFEADTREQLLAHSANDLYDDPDERRKISNEILARGTINGMEVRYRTLKGRAFWGRISATKKTSDDGRIFFDNTIEDITDRKRFEEEQGRLAAIVESSDQAIIGKTLDGIITSWNVGAERMYGYSAEEVTGRNISLLIPPDHVDDTRQILEQIRYGPPVHRYETVRRTKDGRQIPVLLTVSSIRDAENRVTGASTIAYDITNRKRLEDVLKSSESRYRRFFEAVRDGILIIDAGTGTILDVNPFLIELLGFTHEQFLGKKLWEIGVFKDIAASKENFKELQEKKYIHFEDLPLETADGRRIYAEFVSFVYDVEDKKVMQCNIRDITERKKSEDVLKSSESRYRRFFEAVRDGILIIDAGTGTILDVNPFLIELLGFTHEQFLGKKLWEIGVFKDIAASKENFKELQEKKYIHFEDLPLETADGRRIYAEFVSFVYDVEDKKVMQCNIRDITERKQAEVLRESMIRELGQKNAELERFTYTVSHDLKSPLITIQGFVGMIEDDVRNGDPVQLKKDILRITTAADTMQELLSDVLKLSRIGRVVSPPEKTPFGIIVHEAVDLLAGPLAGRGVRIEIAPDLPDVVVDHTRIREVMVNLIENAIKFAGDRPDPVIRIGADRGGETPVFFVRDNGIGIDPRYLDRIFNLFERLDTGTHGTGIGLTIARRIIEVHGGKLWAESEGAGKGTTFRFTLPGAGEPGTDNNNNGKIKERFL